MGIIKKSSYKLNLFLLTIGVILVLYAYNDVTTNAQAGNIGLDRSSVYILVLSLLFVISVNAFKNFSISFFKLPYVRPLSFLTLWLFTSNLLNDNFDRGTQLHLMLSVLWIFTYYDIYIHGMKYKRYNSIALLFSCMMLVYFVVNLYAQSNITSQLGRDFGMTSYAYYLLAIMPFVILIPNKLISRIIFISACLLVIVSLKRGPIITLGLMLISYYVVSNMIGTKLISFKALLFLVVFLVFACYFINDYTDGFLAYRFSSDEMLGASGRDEMWRQVINTIENRSVFSSLIGFGSGASIKLLGTGVHNEWLEFLLSFGLIGVCLYFTLLLSFIDRVRKLIKIKSPLAPLYSMIICFFIFSGMSDGFYFVYWTFYFFASIGLLEALIAEN